MINPDGDHDQRQRDSDNDQEVPDLKHRLLCVDYGTGSGHKLGGAAKKVLAPVAMPTACISPCLTMLPE